jgi:hypothetical protein
MAGRGFENQKLHSLRRSLYVAFEMGTQVLAEVNYEALVVTRLSNDSIIGWQCLRM